MNTPSVTTSIRVLREIFEPKRTRKPTVSPAASPKLQAIRAAAARAASRRGSSTRIFRPATQGSFKSASGTRVVLPAPGGATSTAERPETSASRRRGNVSSTGKGSRKGLVIVSCLDRPADRA